MAKPYQYDGLPQPTLIIHRPEGEFDRSIDPADDDALVLMEQLIKLKPLHIYELATGRYDPTVANLPAPLDADQTDEAAARAARSELSSQQEVDRIYVALLAKVSTSAIVDFYEFDPASEDAIYEHPDYKAIVDELSPKGIGAPESTRIVTASSVRVVRWGLFARRIAEYQFLHEHETIQPGTITTLPMKGPDVVQALSPTGSEG
jgi:hypothetical protein